MYSVLLTIDEDNSIAPGLMFKFGSVVGVSAGKKNFQSFNPETDVLFDPTSPAKFSYKRWADVPYTENGKVIHDHPNVMLGKGDPCRLVGLTPEQIRSGEVDNEKWRLPMGIEFEWFMRTYVCRGRSNEHKCWKDSPTYCLLANGIFFPAAGYRLSSNGAVKDKRWGGHYWCSSQTDKWGKFFSYYLYFDSGIANINSAHSAEYSAGYSVRCVRQ